MRWIPMNKPSKYAVIAVLAAIASTVYYKSPARRVDLAVSAEERRTLHDAPNSGFSTEASELVRSMKDASSVSVPFEENERKAWTEFIAWAKTLNGSAPAFVEEDKTTGVLMRYKMVLEVDERSKTKVTLTEDELKNKKGFFQFTYKYVTDESGEKLHNLYIDAYGNLSAAEGGDGYTDGGRMSYPVKEASARFAFKSLRAKWLANVPVAKRNLGYK
ncbi:MAG: hypothetical protein A2V88_02965 [Elusimicrobia bacterium RBG_16_66_12]|nr:MAG: hypothetical protein A2V88_02965 [Elusimicrobia bacterium RBG_16_66_12]